MLGSVATLALAGVLSVATPSLASEGYSDNPSQVSTPQEKAETADLNRSQANGTLVSPDKLNGTAPTTAPLSTETSAADSAQQERDSQYKSQQNQYQDQLNQAGRDQAQYERDLSRYDRQEYAYSDYPRSYQYRYADDAHYGQRLYLIADPTHQLAQKPIEDPSGAWVGKVRNVETAVDGRPLRIEVALNRRVSVWVRPDHFRFDTTDGILFTDLTRRELWNYPGATFESSDND